MIVDIAKILGTRPEKHAERIDELAERLVGGEKVDREEIRVFLDRIEAAPEELQAAVDRLTRRRELLATIRDAAPPRKRLADIEAEIAMAAADVERAEDIVARIRSKYREKLFDLRTTVEAADRAAVALLEYRNLPPSEAARLRAARDAANQAEANVDRLKRELPALRGQLREAEQAHDQERATLALQRDDRMVQDQVARARNRFKACDARLKDASASLAAAETALVEARRRRDRVTAEVAERYGK